MVIRGDDDFNCGVLLMTGYVNTKTLVKNNLKNISNNIYVTIIYDGKNKVLKRHKTIYTKINQFYGICECVFKIKEKTQILCLYIYGEKYICTGEYYTSDGTYKLIYRINIE